MKRSETSLKAFHNEENRKRRQSHKNRILEFLERHKSYSFTSLEIAMNIGLTHQQVWKRTSQLDRDEGRIKVTGTTRENGREVKVYQFYSWEIIEQPKKSFEQIFKEKVQKYDSDLFNRVYREAKQEYRFNGI